MGPETPERPGRPDVPAGAGRGGRRGSPPPAERGSPPPAGIAYDYVLGGDGLFVAAGSPLLRVRVPLARCAVRGLPPLSAACALTHGRVPLALWDAIAAAAARAHALGREVLLVVRH